MLSVPCLPVSKSTYLSLFPESPVGFSRLTDGNQWFSPSHLKSKTRPSSQCYFSSSAHLQLLTHFSVPIPKQKFPKVLSLAPHLLSNPTDWLSSPTPCKSLVTSCTTFFYLNHSRNDPLSDPFQTFFPTSTLLFPLSLKVALTRMPAFSSSLSSVYLPGELIRSQKL